MLSLLWIGALLCYVWGLTNPTMGLLAMLLAIASPFFAASRLRHFRDYAREGIISFRRGYAFTVMTFFYAGLLMAVAVFVYFAYIDKGYLMMKYSEMIHSEELQQTLDMYGMRGQMEQGLRELNNMRPIDFALNMLTINIMTGFLLGLPIAALAQRKSLIIKK